MARAREVASSHVDSNLQSTPADLPFRLSDGRRLPPLAPQQALRPAAAATSTGTVAAAATFAPNRSRFGAGASAGCGTGVRAGGGGAGPSRASVPQRPALRAAASNGPSSRRHARSFLPIDELLDHRLSILFVTLCAPVMPAGVYLTLGVRLVECHLKASKMLYVQKPVVRRLQRVALDAGHLRSYYGVVHRRLAHSIDAHHLQPQRRPFSFGSAPPSVSPVCSAQSACRFACFLKYSESYSHEDLWRRPRILRRASAWRAHPPGTRPRWRTRRVWR